MSLRENIETFMAQFLEQVPKEIQDIMQEESERLVQSDITDHSLTVGDKAPDFSLPNIEGTLVSSADLLSRGPLVVSFYRGGW